MRTTAAPYLVEMENTENTENTCLSVRDKQQHSFSTPTGSIFPCTCLFLFSQYMSPYLSLPLSPPIYIQEHIRRHVDTCINIHIQCTNMHTHPDKPKHERTGTCKSTFGPALCVFSNDARRSEFQPR